jgi:sn-glycerol 3-phosphate transport system substrate-binding protein
MIKTMTMLRDLVYKYRIMPQKWTDWEGGQAFLTGKLAMGPFTSSVITYGEQNLPWKLRIAPMPSVNGKRYTVLAGSGLVDFSSSKKKRKAVDEFMFWLINKENTIRLHKVIGSIPVRTSALNSLELRAFHKENPNYRIPIESLEFARPLPRLVEYYKINKRLRDMLQRIFMEGADIVTELKKAEEDINSMMY